LLFSKVSISSSPGFINSETSVNDPSDDLLGKYSRLKDTVETTYIIKEIHQAITQCMEGIERICSATIWRQEILPGKLPAPKRQAYLLGLWGLPESIVQAVAFHQEPDRFPGTDFSPLTALHVANALCSNKDIHMEYLKRISLDHRLDDWRALHVPSTERNLYEP